MAEKKRKSSILKILPRLCVLVVEDSEFDRELATATLKKIGVHTVQVAENGSLAIAKLKNAIAVKKPFDIIFLDAKMPCEDGVKVLRWIRQEPKLKDQIVIMVTATPHPEEVAEFIDLGINGYVVKPLTLEVLQSKIFEALKLQGGKKKRYAS